MSSDDGAKMPKVSNNEMIVSYGGFLDGEDIVTILPAPITAHIHDARFLPTQRRLMTSYLSERLAVGEKCP